MISGKCSSVSLWAANEMIEFKDAVANGAAEEIILEAFDCLSFLIYKDAEGTSGANEIDVDLIIPYLPLYDLDYYFLIWNAKKESKYGVQLWREEVLLFAKSLV